jgi:hypothetical protein
MNTEDQKREGMNTRVAGQRRGKGKKQKDMGKENERNGNASSKEQRY